MSDADGQVYDPITLLLIQLQYDRADVAVVSSEAASMMDVVIEKVKEAAPGPDQDLGEFGAVRET